MYKFKKERLLTSPKEVRRFTFFSLNLSAFMPSLPVQAHLRLYAEHRMNIAESIRNQASAEALDNIVPEDSDRLEQLLAEGPGIVATFHYGSYRLINQWLVRRGLPFALLVSEKVIHGQGELFKQQYGQIRPTGREDTFQLLDAQHPAALLKMRRLLQQGYYIVMYLDGNTGLPTQPGHMCHIPFLSRSLPVRKGLPLLSYWAGVPIYPVIAARDKQRADRLVSLQPLKVGRKMDREMYAAQVLQVLYAFLEENLQKDPAQWEKWTYLHSDLGWEILENDRKTLKIRQFSVYRFLPFPLDRQFYFIERESFHCFAVNKHIYGNFFKKYYELYDSV